ncbi:unnamed protein product [Cochlearia groenlandica]
MGQAQSNETSASSESPSTTKNPPSPRDSGGDDDTSSSSSSSPMDSLLAEAAAFGEDDNENLSLEEKAQKALDCPCIADLRNGSCGSEFSQAFLCFLKSTAGEKGSDCVHPFVALQSCIKANPKAFPRDVLNADEKIPEIKEEQQQPLQDHRIVPPLWAKDPPRSGKSKL